MIKKEIILTRDSVAAGDDGDAPHYLTIEIDTDDRIEAILKPFLTFVISLKYVGTKQHGASHPMSRLPLLRRNGQLPC